LAGLIWADVRKKRTAIPLKCSQKREMFLETFPETFPETFLVTFHETFPET
jgi:hypothetical protein